MNNKYCDSKSVDIQQKKNTAVTETDKWRQRVDGEIKLNFSICRDLHVEQFSTALAGAPSH